MTKDELLKKVYQELCDDDNGFFSKIGIGEKYEDFIKNRIDKNELSNFVYYARNKNDLSEFCFDNSYERMSEECKEFINKYCKIVNSNVL